MLSCILSASVLASVERPNVLLIYSDDIGYGDLSCYGATKVQTPNLDKIATRGIRFTDAHSASTVCTPSRYSLLTGRSALRNREAWGIIDGQAPLVFKKSETTIAQVFRRSRYVTGVVGKWHLGLGTEPISNFSLPIDRTPKDVGFDYSFIIPATGDRVPCVFLEDGRVVHDDPNDPVLVSFGAKIGTDPTGVENPDLLKEPMMSGHTGTIVNGISRMGYMSGGRKARWIDSQIAETLTKKAVRFIQNARSKPFFLYFATHDVHAPQVPSSRFRGKSSAGLRGDTIMQLDWSVGEVLKALKSSGKDKNTIIIFSSDNGGANNDGYPAPRIDLNGHQFNGGLRGEKYDVYEGGHRIPMMIAWPGQTSPMVSSALVSQLDLFRTLATQIKLPIVAGEAQDSDDLEGALRFGGNRGRRDLLYHVAGARTAWRSGDWVFIPRPGGTPELYNLKTDLAQGKNLAQDLPVRLQRLQEEHAARRVELEQPDQSKL